MKKLYEIVDSFYKPSIVSEQPVSSTKNLAEICWDVSKLGTGIVAQENNKSIFLKEQSYVFRSAIANIGFNGGINYWEIIADPKT